MTVHQQLDPRVVRTRELVLAAAAELLVDEGFERTTLDAIAERSGVARSTLYRNWGCRATLLVEAFGTLLAKPDLAGADLTEMLRRHGNFLARGLAPAPWGRVLPSLIGAAAHDEELRQALGTFSATRRAELVGIIDEAVQRGELAAPEDVAGSLMRFAGSIFFAALVAQQEIDEAFVEAQVRLSVAELTRAQ